MKKNELMKTILFCFLIASIYFITNTLHSQNNSSNLDAFKNYKTFCIGFYIDENKKVTHSLALQGILENIYKTKLKFNLFLAASDLAFNDSQNSSDITNAIIKKIKEEGFKQLLIIFIEINSKKITSNTFQGIRLRTHRISATISIKLIDTESLKILHVLNFQEKGISPRSFTQAFESLEYSIKSIIERKLGIASEAPSSSGAFD